MRFGGEILAVTDGWSIDARALVRPTRTFQALAAGQTSESIRSPLWTAVRRPLFLCLVISCVISLLSASVASIRLIGETALYWLFVPLVEILALAIVIWRRRGSRTFASLIDAFFTGHAAWTLLLLFIGAVMTVAPPQHWWFLLTRLVAVGVFPIVVWSAYVDVCFFRYICGATRRRAVANVAVQRLFAWTLIVWIFAEPSPTPFGIVQEIVDAVAEAGR